MKNNTICPMCGHEYELSIEKVFTPDEIRKMKPEEYEQNREKIMRQLEKGRIVKPKGD
jgi:hypothetical protein